MNTIMSPMTSTSTMIPTILKNRDSSFLFWANCRSLLRDILQQLKLDDEKVFDFSGRVDALDIAKYNTAATLPRKKLPYLNQFS